MEFNEWTKALSEAGDGRNRVLASQGTANSTVDIA